MFDRERSLRKTARQYLAGFDLTGLLKMIWEEHQKMFTEDNIATRHAHFIECLEHLKNNDLEKIRLEFPNAKAD